MIPQSIRLRSAALLALAASLTIMLGCGKQDPATYVKSAQAHLAKKDYKAAAIQFKNAIQLAPNAVDTRLMYAKALMEMGDAANAASELRRARELGAAPDQVNPQLALAMLETGNFQVLVDEFAEASLGTLEGTADVQTLVGHAFTRLGKTKEANAAYAKALRARPDHLGATAGVARLALMAQDLKQASALIERLVAQAPDSVDAIMLRGELAMAKGETLEAIDVLERVVKLQPRATQARYALVSALLQKRDLERAAQHLEAVRKLGTPVPAMQYLEASLALMQGRFTDARNLAQAVLKAHPEHVPSLILAGSIELRGGSLGFAEEYLRKALLLAPENLTARRMLVGSYSRGGQTDRAIETLQPLLNRSKPDAATYALAGEVYLAANDLKNAMQFFERSIAADKDNPALRTRLAQVRLSTGDARAVPELEAIARGNDSSFNADVILVMNYLRQNAPDKALAAVARLAQKQPDNPMTYQLAGASYQAKRDATNARASFEKALSLQPAYVPALRALAQIDVMEGKSGAARQRYEELVNKNQANSTVLLAYAATLRGTGADPKEIGSVLERAVRSDTAAVEPRIALIDHYISSGDPRRAMQAAQEANTLIPNNPRIADALGVAQQASGNINQAIETLRQAALQQPKAAQPQIRLAGALAAAKDYTRAAQTLRRALALEPQRVELHRDVALYMARAGRNDEALAEARAVQKARPKDALGWAIEGEVHQQRKDWRAAVDAYRQAQRLGGEEMVSRQVLAALAASPDPAEARRYAERWSKEAPQDPLPRMYLADISMKSKELAGAAERYRELLVLRPNNPVFLNNLAWVSAQLGEPAALKYAEDAHRLAPNSPAVLDTLGWLLVEQGEDKRGVDLLTRAIGLAPNAPEIRMHLAKALIKVGNKADARKELETIAKMPEARGLHAEAASLLKTL